MDAEMDDDDDVDPADSMYAPRNTDREDAQRFVRGLPFCHPLLAGFHYSHLLDPTEQNSRICYCPCSPRGMDRWQRCFHLDDLNTFHCNLHVPKSPHDLYKHVEAVAAKCKYHKLLKTFLLTVLSDYHQPGMRHIGLENKKNLPYKKAMAFITARPVAPTVSTGASIPRPDNNIQSPSTGSRPDATYNGKVAHVQQTRSRGEQTSNASPQIPDANQPVTTSEAVPAGFQGETKTLSDVYHLGKDNVDAHEGVNVNKRKGIDTTVQSPTDPRKKKFNNKFASPLKKGNDEVASPLVDESPQKLNEEVETANNTMKGSAVNGTAVADDNVAHLTNENPFFGNDVEEKMDDNGVSAVAKLDTVPQLDTAQAAEVDTILAGMRRNDEAEQPELPPAKEHTEEDAEREESESEDDKSRTGGKGNGDKRNSNKKNAWSTDTPDGQFINSTNYMIIEWLKTGTNYKEWKEIGRKRRKQGKTQTEMIAALKNDINSAGVNRNRTTIGIGLKIRKFEEKMNIAHSLYKEKL